LISPGKEGKVEQNAFELGVPKKPQPGQPTKEADWIEEMVGALFDPLIVWPSPWQDSIPENLKKELPLRRLAHLMLCQKGEASWEEATDLEALLYMYPLTLEHPIDRDWTEIYLYLGTKCYGERFPQDIRHESLRPDQVEDLRELKRWIYRQRVKARIARARGEKAEAKQEPVKYEQARFF
jgi:hypothetical protein